MRTLGSYPLIILFFLFAGQMNAQSAGIASLNEVSSFTDLNYLPVLTTSVKSTTNSKPLFRALPAIAEGQKAIGTFLRERTSYPEIAIENAIEGTVILAIEVNADGSIAATKIEEPLFGPIDQLVLDNAKELPNLLPAVFNGQAVKKELLIPIHFRLQ